MSIPQERRRYPRAEVKWPVIVNEPQGPMDGVIRDVSFGGALIRCPKPLNLREAFGILINVPDVNRPMEIVAEIVRSSMQDSDDEIAPWAMGVKFKDIN